MVDCSRALDTPENAETLLSTGYFLVYLASMHCVGVWHMDIPAIDR
jgi:hypothetical protein